MFETYINNAIRIYVPVPFESYFVEQFIRTRSFYSTKFFGCKIHPLYEGASIDPCRTSIPAFHRWWITQRLAHVLHSQLSTRMLILWPINRFSKPHNSSNQLGWAFNLFIPAVLRFEEIRVEHKFHYRPYVIFVVKIRLYYLINCLRISGGLIRPLRDWRFVSNKEMVNMPSYETSRCLLFANNFNYIFAIESSFATKKFLFSIIMIVSIKFIMPGNPTIRPI